MPSSPSTLAGLLIQQTKSQIFNAALAVAETLNLPVTSWQAGDPTRSLYFLESEILAALEQMAVGFIQSGFLSFAALPVNDADGNPLPVNLQWLTNLAKQQFNVDVPDASFAETDVLFTNSGGGVYDFEPGDVTVKNSTSGKTYHTTTGGHLAASGGTLTMHVVADEVGSASSAGASEIDTLVTTLLGVTCSNPGAAVGLDVQDPSVTIQQCLDKAASLSPDGPAAAYSFVARNPTLTGINTVTRVRVYPDSDTGDVLVYIAGAAGGVSSGDRTAVQNAITNFATPLTITPTVTVANDVIVNVTYTIWIYTSVNQNVTQIKAAILTALEQMFSLRPISGDVIPPATTGSLYADLVKATIERVFPKQTFRVTLSAPSSDVSLSQGDVPQLGTVTGTVNIIPDPT